MSYDVDELTRVFVPVLSVPADYIGNRMIINGDIKGEDNVFIIGDMTPMDRFLLPIFCMFMLAGKSHSPSPVLVTFPT